MGTYNDVFDIKFSTGFDYTNTETWTYMDYFVFYLYSKYLAYSNNFVLEQLKAPRNVIGEFVKIGTAKSGTSITEFEYFYKIDSSILPAGTQVYLKVRDILNISNKNVLQNINLNTTLDKNNFDKTE